MKLQPRSAPGCPGNQPSQKLARRIFGQLLVVFRGIVAHVAKLTVEREIGQSVDYAPNCQADIRNRWSGDAVFRAHSRCRPVQEVETDIATLIDGGVVFGTKFPRPKHAAKESSMLQRDPDIGTRLQANGFFR
jgi:hypothetical protein